MVWLAARLAVACFLATILAFAACFAGVIAGSGAVTVDSLAAAAVAFVLAFFWAILGLILD